jgi:hypothetical protein
VIARAAFVLACAAAIAACDGAACEIATGDTPVYTHRLGCEADFVTMSTDRDDAVFAHTLSTNVIVDREDGDAVYFIDPDAYLLHFQFAQVYLNDPGKTPVGDLAAFNLLNYRRDNRRFLLAKVVHYLDQDLFTYELAAGDTAGVDLIEFGYQRIADALGVTRDLRYRPVSADQEALLPELAERIPTVRTADVFGGQTYQPLNKGVGYGVLVFRSTATLSGEPFAPTDLVVLDRVPNDLSMCAGIITAEFQTPLAHVGILAKTRGTPNMALRDAFTDDRLRGLEGRLVRLEVGAQDFTIEEADPAEAQAYWDSLRPTELQVPDYDQVTQPMIDVTLARADDAVRIGSKAANLGELYRIRTTGARDIPTPDRPFAIPFAHYAQHLAASGVQPLIDAVIADYAAGLLDPAELEARLFEIRWALYRAPISETLLDTVIARMADRWTPATKARFRSSTNVEDLEDFTGAGLYTSASGSVEDGRGSIANAIKTVWASVWNASAFIERDFYRVDHGAVRMGVLVHPASEDDLVNGVAVTINEFSELRPAFYINSQIGEISVTNPTGGAISEQILYYTWYEEPEYEVITRSSLLGWTEGWPSDVAILTDPELDELAEYLSAIHAAFRARYPMTAVDVEWKLNQDRSILIKQARPYKRREPETGE